MANNGTVSISFVLKDQTNGFKTLTLGASDLRKVLSSTVTEAQKLNNKVINFASFATGINAVSDTLSNIQNSLSGLSDAYAAQIEAETKLAVNMRNTMGAREEDIRSIKELCSAQQELGVIGDEVQLAGAQELATYLTHKESLEKLIPVMNDMLAQQYGLNATQENAANIATMLGKVMDGQTGALSRYGYSFDEVQEKILKCGTEAQRASVLYDVVSSAVGGMNAELAKTDVGKQKQISNWLGDIKESAGGVAQIAMPLLSVFANTTVAAGGIIKLYTGLGILGKTLKNTTISIKLFWVATATLSSGMTGLTKVVGTARLFIFQFCTALTQGIRGLKLFAIAWKGLLISTGIGIAIAAVTSVIAYFALKTDEATAATEKFLSVEERAKRDAEQLENLRQQEVSTLNNARAALEINISKLKEFNGTKEQEKKLVNEMNDTYGDTMGYFSSVADWYKALISNSEAYCKQMVAEARARTLANQIAEKEQETHDIVYDENGKKRLYSTKRKLVAKNAILLNEDSRQKYLNKRDDIIYDGRDFLAKSARDKAQEAVNVNAKTIANLRSQMQKAVEESASIKYEMAGSSVRPTTPESPEKHKKEAEVPKFDKDASNLKGYKNNILALNHELETASEERAAEINKEIVLWQERADKIRNAGMAAVYKEEASNLKEISGNIAFLKEQLEEASKEDAAGINRKIERWETEAAAYREAGKAPKDKFSYKADASSIKEITDNISYLNNALNETKSQSEAARLNAEIDAWNRKADAMRNAGKEAKVTFDTYRQGWDGIKGIGEGIDNITGALEGNGNVWQKITAIIDGFIQVYDGLRGVIDIINMITAATRTQSVATGVEAGATIAKTAATQADTVALESNTAASLKNTVAKSGESISGAVSSGAKLPFPANIVAIAAGVAAVVSALSIIGSFSTGGIVGGNSPYGDKLLAKVNSGEMILNKTQQLRLYNALNGNGTLGCNITLPNNSRVSPEAFDWGLLRSMLNPVGEPVIIGGTLRASGREIVCVLANETRIASKSGRKTNIKL